jgi:D-hydroxyproline dehydrogenase subunit alpha
LNLEPDKRADDSSFEVAIVGAGPAGLAAADILCGRGVKTVVIDEQPRAGGQILRQPPEKFRVASWMTSPLYRKTKQLLHRTAARSGSACLFSTSVLGVVREQNGSFRLWIQNERGCDSVMVKALLLASGCYERPMAFPGWTLPGVMGAGAIQAFLKSQQFVPGDRFLFAGSHPLQLVVADQLLAAGADVAAVLFTQPPAAAMAMIRHPLALVQGALQLSETARILRRLRRASIPIRFGASIVSAEGRNEVEGATVAPVDRAGRLDRARSETVVCNRIGMCYGFAASSELARQAGADAFYRPHDGGWLVRHDRWFESTVPRLFVAGEVTGLAGADASLYKGQLAGIGLARTLSKMGDREATRQARPARWALRRYQGFAVTLNRLSRPPANLATALMTDETCVCRCESISYGDLHRVLSEHNHIRTANAAKLATRAGMGMCQGRLCGHNVMQLVSEARRTPVSDVGGFQVQFPVKPLNISLLGD